MKIYFDFLGVFCRFASLPRATRTQTEMQHMKNTNTETVIIEIASVMDDSGTGEIKTMEISKDRLKAYEDGMAKMAEWG